MAPRSPRRLALIGAVLLCALAASVTGSTHPLAPRQHTATGATVAVGAGFVTLRGYPIGLFEFYVQSAGTVVEQRGDDGMDGPPAASAGPWVAAMLYPYAAENNVTTFQSRPADDVRLSAVSGGVVSFSMPGVGKVRLKLTGSSGSPANTPFGLTTPGEHHGHTWDIAGALVQARHATIGGSITRRGITYRIKPLVIGGARIAWIGEAAVVRIQTN